MKAFIRVAIEQNRDKGKEEILRKDVIKGGYITLSNPIDRCPFNKNCCLCLYLFPELIDFKPMVVWDQCPCNIIGHDRVQEFVNNYLNE